MKLSQAAKMAFSAVLSNKLRSFLTMLGIIIGVMAVILLISLVQGASNTVTDELDELGGDQLIVSITDQHKRMTLHEAESFADLEGVAYVSPVLSGNGTAKALGNSIDVTINGITAAYQNVQGLDLVSGRPVSRTDNDYRLSVCVVGQKVAEDLFGGTDILGRTIRLSGRDYRIIGLLEEKERTMVSDENATIYIPLTNAQRILKNVNVSMFYVAGRDGVDLESLRKELNAKLSLKYSDEDSYMVVNMADVMDIIDRVMGALGLLLAAIAGISLVVGGIGIMNIMLVSVTERTREIGIRKAIGAQKSDIITQFMIESVVISLAGGMIGLVLSQGILSTINTLYPNYHFLISPDIAGIALGFSILVGVIFGIYPAGKAASLKPINALRYE